MIYISIVLIQIITNQRIFVLLIAQIPTVGQFTNVAAYLTTIIGDFFIISQIGDSNEHHMLKFCGELINYVFGYHKYTHLFWSTDKLGIYHFYRKHTVFCMQNTIIENKIIIKVT